MKRADDDPAELLERAGFCHAIAAPARV
jgi:hypothetical protein